MVRMKFLILARDSDESLGTAQNCARYSEVFQGYEPQFDLDSNYNYSSSYGRKPSNQRREPHQPWAPWCNGVPLYHTC